MKPTLSHIWRFPIKGIGSEALEEVRLEANAPLPGDRAWALMHEGAADHDNWQPRRNYLVVASGPNLAAVRARTQANGHITLTHPECEALTFDPDSDDTPLINWVRPLWPTQHSAPKRFLKSPPEGMADNGLAQVSIMNLSSLRALSQKTGVPLDPKRFRGNIWIDGLGPWEEFDLIGKTIQIGSARLDVTERIERCRATEANPETGRRDVDPVKALSEGWGHRDFGVYATVTAGGKIATGDAVVLS